MPAAVIIISSVPGADLNIAADAARQLVPRVILADKAIGYGAALSAAFDIAGEAGCTHAIVLDVGRGHAPTYIATFIEAARRSPDAMIVGVRRYSESLPSRSQRFGRWNCDLWTWAETGRWIHDTTYGFKAYPLQLVRDLAVRATATDFEVELLAKAIWTGAQVIQIPLPTDARAEALAPLQPVEVVRFVATTAWLVLQRLMLPAPLLATMHRKAFAQLPLMQRLGLICREGIVRNSDRPARFAACVGIGVFFGIVPIWGFQMIAAAATAHLLGLSKPLVLAASQVSSPLTLPLILYMSLLAGHFLFHGQMAGLPRPDQLNRLVLLRYLGEYVAGSIALAFAAGLAALLLAFVTAKTLKSLRGKPQC
jgi:uncharacterized protein (DUF2062 family)